VILDTNAVSALLTGNQRLGKVLRGDEHHLALHVIAEFQFGLRSLKRPRRLQSLFRILEAGSIVLCPDRLTADIYTDIRHALKRKGTPIPENDIWIASLARQFHSESLLKTCISMLLRGSCESTGNRLEMQFASWWASPCMRAATTLWRKSDTVLRLFAMLGLYPAPILRA
jgi:tRNA(fMet)-specific endonuclease VapC